MLNYYSLVLFNIFLGVWLELFLISYLNFWWIWLSLFLGFYLLGNDLFLTWWFFSLLFFNTFIYFLLDILCFDLFFTLCLWVNFIHSFFFLDLLIVVLKFQWRIALDFNFLSFHLNTFYLFN